MQAEHAVAVATFADRAAADAAITALRDAGCGHVWLGVTRTVDDNTFGGAGGTVGEGRERVRDADAGNPLARWFHRESDRTLYDALRDHGVEDADARAIDGSVVEGDCVLVVEDGSDAKVVERLVLQHGGTLRAAGGSNGARSSRTATIPTFREEFFVRRDAPPSDLPAEY